jgi:hypothetical protein
MANEASPERESGRKAHTPFSCVPVSVDQYNTASPVFKKARLLRFGHDLISYFNLSSKKTWI